MRSLLKIDILYVDAQPADARSYKRVKSGTVYLKFVAFCLL